MAPEVKTAKNSKLPKLPESCFEPVGKGGWPSISTWINPPSLGSNGLHCIECPGERKKCLLNLNLGEYLPCWRHRAAQFVEVCHEPVEAEVVQQVELHERTNVHKESLCFAATLSTCFCWIEGAWGEVVVVAVSFCSPFEQIVKKLNFVV
jgi:hypothetical protein